MFGFFKKKEKNDFVTTSILPRSITESSELELRDILAPSALKVNTKELNLGEKVVRSFFVISYPRFLGEDWFAPIINMDKMFDVSIFIHPLETAKILRSFQKKVAEVQSQIRMREEKGLVRDPMLDTAYQDLENLRTLMFDAEVLVIDPENEYQYMAEAVGGRYFNISLNSDHHINPFELPVPGEDESNASDLRSQLINLVGLFRIMMGRLTAGEDAVIDRAITETYSLKGISADSNFKNVDQPLLS